MFVEAASLPEFPPDLTYVILHASSKKPASATHSEWLRLFVRTFFVEGAACRIFN
jgi:hypothetical protein